MALLSQNELLKNTLIHPVVNFQSKLKLWQADQLTNDAIDLILLLQLIAEAQTTKTREQAACINVLNEYFFPKTRVSQRQLFLKMRGTIQDRGMDAQAESVEIRLKELYAHQLEHFALLKQIALLPQDKFNDLMKIFPEESPQTEITINDYLGALSILCGTLRKSVAKLNGLDNNAAPPGDIDAALSLLAPDFQNTQHKYAFYDANNDWVAFHSQRDHTLFDRRRMALLAVGTIIFFSVAVNAMANADPTGAIICSIATLAFAAAIFHLLGRIKEEQKICEAKHREFEDTMREKLGLDLRVDVQEYPEPSCFDPFTSKLSTFYRDAQERYDNWQRPLGSSTHNGYEHLLKNDDDDEGNKNSMFSL